MGAEFHCAQAVIFRFPFAKKKSFFFSSVPGFNVFSFLLFFLDRAVFCYELFMVLSPCSPSRHRFPVCLFAFFFKKRIAVVRMKSV
jgi:hypothetical protein